VIGWVVIGGAVLVVWMGVVVWEVLRSAINGSQLNRMKTKNEESRAE